MTIKSKEICQVCNSTNLVKFNSYKHHCYACGDCNSIHHVKKNGKYFLEWFLPVKLLSKLLPREAVLRLFHAPPEGFKPSEFYDGYANEALYNNKIKLSQIHQLTDLLEIQNIDISEFSVLDISGGPGVLVQALKEKCKRAVVTEYSETSVNQMKKSLNIEAVKFDYLNDELEEVLDSKYDLVLIRSSIIFCSDIDKLMESISKILNPNGYILLETIIPTLGEVFWWQQMEYKFPIIYSQMSLESIFYRSGYILKDGYRDYGSYIGIKSRGEKGRGLGRFLFTWLIDYPMVLFYYIICRKSKIPIDTSLKHKFLTQLWQRNESNNSYMKINMANYKIGDDNKSPHFSYIYNNYLKNKRSI